MFRKGLILFALAFIVQSGILATNKFATKRLQQIAVALPNIPFEQLDVGTHTKYQHLGYALNIRVNKSHEIEHIGYLLFDDMVRTNQSTVYDFVERYTLTLEPMDDLDRNMRMGIDKFRFETGSLQDIHKIKNTDSLVVLMVENKGYHMAWHRDGICFLSILFNMDYQMLVSSNAIELEQRYLRIVGHRDTMTQLVPPILRADSNDIYAIEDNGSYLVDAIRATRYFERNSTGNWTLVLSPSQSHWSASNLMLSPEYVGNYTLKCRLDMYGYKDSSFSISLNRWISETMREGCKMYFGLKSRSSKVIHGTVFCPNPTAGYCHMMSVDIPIEAIKKHSGSITGRLYVYIPLHNITDDYFDLKYLPINKENQ